MANEVKVTPASPASPAVKKEAKPRKKTVSDPEFMAQKHALAILTRLPDVKARARVINYLQVRLNEEAATATV